MARTKKRARCRGCGAEYDRNKPRQQYCSRGCAGRSKGGASKKSGLASSPPGKKNPNFKHGLYSKLLLPAGREVYDARQGKADDPRAELELQIALADAVFAQVAQLALTEPAALSVLAKAMDTRNAAVKALSLHDLRDKERSEPRDIHVTVNVRNV